MQRSESRLPVYQRRSFSPPASDAGYQRSQLSLFHNPPCQGRDDCRKPRQDPGKFQYPEFFLEPNVTFLADPALSSVYFDDINTEVYGFSYHTTEIREPLLEDIQVPLNNRIQILLRHGGDPAHVPMNFNTLSLSPFSYIALGHIHKAQVIAEDKWPTAVPLNPWI